MNGTIRVMKGQQAAVCGLLLLGLAFTEACKIVGVSPDRMRPYVPDDMLRYRKLPVSLKKMGRKRRHLYLKMRGILPQSKAFAEAMR